MPRRPTALTIALVVTFAFGVLLRVWALVGQFATSDSDEGAWALMSLHVLDGEFPVYFWGQRYGGTIEVYLAAPLVWLLGALSAARAVVVLLTVAATGLVWLVGRRALDSRRAAVAAALFWVWPAYAAWKSTRVHGFYASGQVLGLLVLFLVLRLAERPGRRDAVLFGVVLGLAAWQTLQALPLVLPALAWLAWRRPSAYRLAWLAVPGFLLGAAPALYVNVRNGWWFHSFAPGGGSYADHLRGFFTAALSQQFGLRVPFSLRWLVPAPLGVLIVAAAVAGAVFLFIRHRREPVGLLAAVALCFPFVYAISPYTWYVVEPRYLYVLAPVIALLVAAPLRSAWLATAVLAGALAVSAVGMDALGGGAYERRNGGIAVPADLTPILRALDERGITRAVSEYWLSYRVILATDERIILNNSQDTHYAPYRRLVAAAGRYPPFVYITGSPIERAVQPQLERDGYTRETFGGFSLWTRH